MGPALPLRMPYRPDPRVLRLAPPVGPGGLWDEVRPAAFPMTRLRFRNQRHAARIGLDTLDDAAWLRHLAGFEPLPDNLDRPLALRYHGHQFRHYNPRLGDGRGFLYAQVRGHDGRLLDLGTKGSGTTPWSRGGDGRLTLKGGVREVLATELLEALGVHTSKSLSLVETGESLVRGDEPSPTRSSVLVRLSHGHVRVGTFQRLAALGDAAGMRALVGYACSELLGVAEDPDALLDAAVRRTADTAAAWMVAGFVHGVLNTDNLNITGESFDYGPWRFLVAFDPEFTAAYFDGEGLYAYGRQPEAIVWNLMRLHEALSLLGPVSTAPLSAFMAHYRASLTRRTLARLGLAAHGGDADDALCVAVWGFLEHARIPGGRVPFDRFFFDAYAGEARLDAALAGPFGRVYAHPSFAPVRRAWAQHQPAHPERLTHPYLSRPGPVSLVLPVVEGLWAGIDQQDDWSAFERVVADVRELGDLLADGDQSADSMTRMPDTSSVS